MFVRNGEKLEERLANMLDIGDTDDNWRKEVIMEVRLWSMGTLLRKTERRKGGEEMRRRKRREGKVEQHINIY